MNKKLQQAEILKEMGNLLFFAYEGTGSEITKPVKEDFVDVLEGLKHLRVLMKYQRFDLEATRRENDFLRDLLGRK